GTSLHRFAIRAGVPLSSPYLTLPLQHARIHGDDGDLAVRFLHRVADVGNVRALPLADARAHVLLGQADLPQVLLDEVPVVDEQHGSAANQAAQPPRTE